MGYYKEINKVLVDGSNFSAVGTRGEVKKRGVDIYQSIEIDNMVEKITLVNFYNTSGKVEYGLEVVLDCKFNSGVTVQTCMSGIDYLNILQEHESYQGSITGNFLFLFQGVVEKLVVGGSKEHKSFLKSYKKQEREKERIKEFKVQEGDIVNLGLHGAVYLGEYYYPKPNFKNETYLNKLRKYKMYLEYDKDGNYGKLRVVSGGAQSDQPTEITGRTEVDLEQLVKESKEHLKKMTTYGVGYAKGYFSIKPYDRKNNKAYVLAHMVKDKKYIKNPSKEDLLKWAWLCGWTDTMKNRNFKRVKNGERDVTPYQYEEAD